MGADVSAGRSGAPSRWPATFLVGRSREQVFLREEWAAALAGRGRLVLLGGEAGIGKTTLARDLMREAQGHGASVLIGHCYDLANAPPYGPWLDLFAGFQLDSGLPLSPAAFSGGRLEAITDQAALVAEVRGFFAELAATRPALVLLEDLHWADPASLDLLRHVAPWLGRWSILLVVTYRDDELTRHHPFAQQLPALAREANGFRLDLRPLDTHGLRSLVASHYRLSMSDEDRLVTYLKRHAEGNPFFATELLRALEDEELLLQTDGRWSLTPVDRVVMPSSLRQVIDGRVARLGEGTRQPLAIAAVIGQEVPMSLWAEVAHLADEELLAIVEQAVETHLLVAERNGTRVRFAHALTREALYEGALPPRRRRWHKQIADALLASGDPDPDAVAYHLQQAGDLRSWEWLIKAGDRAQRAYAWLTAIERFRAASAILATVEGHERTRIRLDCRIAILHRFSDPAGAIEASEAAERLAHEVGDLARAAEARYIRGMASCFADRFRTGLVDMTMALETIEALPPEAEQLLDTMKTWFVGAFPAADTHLAIEEDVSVPGRHAAWLGYLRRVRFWLLASAGQPQATVVFSERYIASVADGPGTLAEVRSAIGFAHHGLGVAYAALGRPDEACFAGVRARELFRAFSHHALVAFSLLNELRDCGLTTSAADPAARRRLAAEAEAVLDQASGALRPGISPRLAWLGCLVLDGRWARADEILRDLPAPGNAFLRREITGARAVLAHHRGESEQFWSTIRPLFANGPGTEPGDQIHQEGLLLQRLAADHCLDAGDLPAARAWLEANDSWLAWSGSVLGRADGRVAWARWHRASGDTMRARTTAAEALALAEAPRQPLVCLSAHRLLGEIETEARHPMAAEAHLTTALNLAAACEAPFERALTLLALAELRASQGATGEAVALVDGAREICVRLRARPALACADALTARLAARPSPQPLADFALSPREIEILRLMVRRLSDKEIAEALFLSPHTVHRHAANVFAKLGVANRREAAALAVHHGLA